VYWPLAEILPAPATASPPVTFQVTVAAAPLESEAANFSIDAPEVLLPLQPVQLVSMVTEPGVMEKLPFEEGFPFPLVELAATPSPQPASASNAGSAVAASERAPIRRVPANEAGMRWGFERRFRDSVDGALRLKMRLLPS
jgi:hypothetical protein